MANKGTYAIKKSHNNQTILSLHLFMLRSVPKQDPTQIIAYSTQPHPQSTFYFSTC